MTLTFNGNSVFRLFEQTTEAVVLLKMTASEYTKQPVYLRCGVRNKNISEHLSHVWSLCAALSLQTRWMNLTDSDGKRITAIKAWITLTRSAEDWEVSSVQLSHLIIRQRFVWDPHAAVFQENLDLLRFTVSSIQAFSCRLILQRMMYAMWYLSLCQLTKRSWRWRWRF